MLFRLCEEPAELTEAQFSLVEAGVGRQHLSFDVRVADRALSRLLEILKAAHHEIVGGTERLSLELSRRARSFNFCLGLPRSYLLIPSTLGAAGPPASRRPRRPPSSRGRSTLLLRFLRGSGSRIVGPFPTRAGPNFILPIFEFVEPDKTPVGGFGDKLRKLAEAEIPLTEPGVELQHHLLEAVGSHDVASCGHAAHRSVDEIPRVVGLAGDLGCLSKPGEARVRVVLVAVLNQDVRAGLLDSHTDHILSILLELQNQARKIRVTGEQNESADLGSGEDQLHPVDRHSDVGRVLLRAPVGRSPNQVYGRLGERDDILRIAPPVGISPLDGHLSADDVGLE